MIITIKGDDVEQAHKDLLERVAKVCEGTAPQDAIIVLSRMLAYLCALDDDPQEALSDAQQLLRGNFDMFVSPNAADGDAN